MAPVQQSSSVYEFLVFSKTGPCLFHLDFTGSLNFEKEADKNSDVRQRQKLLFGLIWSIKSFSQMVRDLHPSSQQALHEALDVLQELRYSQVQVSHIRAAYRSQACPHHGSLEEGPVRDAAGLVLDPVRASGVEEHVLPAGAEDPVQALPREGDRVPAF